MQALTRSFGLVNRARAWFTTSPEELREETEQPSSQKRVVLIRRRNGDIKRIESATATSG